MKRYDKKAKKWRDEKGKFCRPPTVLEEIVSLCEENSTITESILLRLLKIQKELKSIWKYSLPEEIKVHDRVLVRWGEFIYLSEGEKKYLPPSAEDFGRWGGSCYFMTSGEMLWVADNLPSFLNRLKEKLEGLKYYLQGIQELLQTNTDKVRKVKLEKE